MCGRFYQLKARAALYRHFGIDPLPEDFEEVGPRYNIAPSATVAVVRADAGVLRAPALLRWGLVGVSAGAFLAGSTFGVMAIRDVTGADDRHSRGKTRALVADGFFVAGVAAVYALWRLGKRAPSTAKIERSHGGL